VGRLIGEIAERLSRRTGIDQVALSGGVFQNVLLVRLARAELTARGLRALTHRLVPPNDGGLALGQVAVAGHSRYPERVRVMVDRGAEGQDTQTALGLAAAALALARRFAAGAAMWCVAPQWPSHGRHVAVEFVHPVIVGKRALPAVHLEGHDRRRPLRLLVPPGRRSVGRELRRRSVRRRPDAAVRRLGA
jgi:hypothetical protein